MTTTTTHTDAEVVKQARPADWTDDPEKLQAANDAVYSQDPDGEPETPPPPPKVSKKPPPVKTKAQVVAEKAGKLASDSGVQKPAAKKRGGAPKYVEAVTTQLSEMREELKAMRAEKAKRRAEKEAGKKHVTFQDADGDETEEPTTLHAPQAEVMDLEQEDDDMQDDETDDGRDAPMTAEQLEEARFMRKLSRPLG